jgi:hypothetical protein
MPVRPGRRLAVAASVVALSLGLAACGGTSATPATTTTASVAGGPSSQQPAPGYDPDASPYPDTDATPAPSSGGPEPSPSVVGPPAPASASPVLAATIHAWTTMTWTIYSHTDREDAAAGTYQFDCVGATDYFLSLGAPAANDAMRASLHIGARYVPRPQAVADYFAALPTGGNGRWVPARIMAEVRPGDIIAVPPRAGTDESGHALIVAGPPLLLANGDYALLVYDSTATPHGPSDTRTWDPRNRPLPANATHPNGRPSGLGHGTIMIAPTASGAPGTMYWSVDGPEYGGQIEIAAPRA